MNTVRTWEGEKRDGAPAIVRTGKTSYLLRAARRLPVGPRRAFAFFEDPRNLPLITPPWLHFTLLDPGREGPVWEGAEFDYTLRWFGVPLRWRSRITEYRPGESFTDEQIRGPYRSWTHRHLFRPLGEGTLMVDEVSYALPWMALPVRRIIEDQLEGIFRYRGRRVAEWSSEAVRQRGKVTRPPRE